MMIKPRNRGNSGHIPSTEEVRTLRGGHTQSYMASLIYTSDRIWRSYELGTARMHPAMWELVNRKLSEHLPLDPASGA